MINDKWITQTISFVVPAGSTLRQALLLVPAGEDMLDFVVPTGLELIYTGIINRTLQPEEKK